LIFCKRTSYVRTDAKDKLTILFSDRDHNTVREALLRSDSHKYAELERKKGADPDPLSTLVYDYEHTSGTVQKLMVVAEGLTKIKDTFTEEDVEDLFPGKGEQMLRNMISADLIIEIGYGRYRAI
jgi:hypothetical protein